MHNTSTSPRQLAVSVLDRCLHGQQPLDQAISESLHRHTLESRDRQFLRHLLYTTLRRLGEIDAILSQFIQKPLPVKAHALKQLLRLAVAELGGLRTPDYAAINSYVDLTKRIGEERRAGFVNAVLRNILRKDATLAERPDAARNTPPWLWQRLKQTYGKDMATAIAHAHLQGAGPDLQFRKGAADWAKKLGATLLPCEGLRLAPRGDIRALEGYTEGAWWVQDIAASLPATLLGNVHGKQVVDLCAAPGGKTAQLASEGAHVTALDSNEKRLEILRDNIERLQFPIIPTPFRGRTGEGVEPKDTEPDGITILHADAATWKPESPPDAILLDAPCSATGIIRRHPDIGWLRRPQDIPELQATQKQLLTHALSLLPAGGTLVYAVCSLLPEEGEQVVDNVLAEHPGYQRQPIQPEELDGHSEWITPQGDLRTLPCHLADLGGMDGFYAARITRQ